MEKFIKTPPVTSGGTYVIQKGKAVQTRQPNHSQAEWSGKPSQGKTLNKKGD